MSARRAAAALPSFALAILVVLLAGCGSTGSAKLPRIKLVGNESCPVPTPTPSGSPSAAAGATAPASAAPPSAAASPSSPPATSARPSVAPSASASASATAKASASRRMGEIQAVLAADTVPAASAAASPSPSAKPSASSTPQYTFPPGVNDSTPVGQAIDEMARTHVPLGTKITYEHNPPTSGCHYPPPDAPVTAGAYDKAIPPEYWVHNLEHGYVVVLYNCPSGCHDDFDKLQSWYGGLPADPGGVVKYAKVLILPYSDMKPKFAMVSWGWYDSMDGLDIDEVQRFYDDHNNHSLEGPGAG